MKRPLKTIIIILFIIIAYWIISGPGLLPSFKNIFASKPVAIDETPILIKEIKAIGQLITYSSLDEVVADSIVVTTGSSLVNTFNRFAPVPLLPALDKQLVIIGRGKILAGINLSLLSDTSISVKNDTVQIYLPEAQILDAIINPSDFEIFVEKGDWANEEVTLVKAKAKRKMIENAIRQNILPKADERAKSIMENFLKNMGFKKITVL